MNKWYIVVIIGASFLAIGCMICGSCSPPDDTGSLTAATALAAARSYVWVPPLFEGVSGSGMYKTRPTKVELDIEPAEFPSELMTYLVMVPDITGSFCREMAGILGFSEEWPLSGRERQVYSYTDGRRALEITLAGMLRYDIPVGIASGALDLPSDLGCVRIATDWLAGYGFYPDSVTRVSVDHVVKTVSVFTTEIGESGPPVHHTKSVHFQTSTDGYSGITSGAMVHIGHNGEVVHATVDLTRSSEYGLVPLISPSTAFEILNEHLSRLTPVIEDAPRCICNLTGVDKVVIQAISIRYQRTVCSGYVLPVYMLEGEAFSGSAAAPEYFKARIDAVRR